MNKIAVFGKPASGKSTLSKRLAQATNIQLYALDSILYEANGDEIPLQRYEQIHQDIICSESWIIEGFGPLNSLDSFKQRLQVADTWIYIDLPYAVTYWLVAKRFLKGLFVKPEGWPADSSIYKGTMQTYKVLKLCPKFWNDKFLQNLNSTKGDRSFYVVNSLGELNGFVERFVE